MTKKERAILQMLAGAGAPIIGSDIVHAVRGGEFEKVDTSLVLEALLAKGLVARRPGKDGRVYTITEGGARSLSE